MWRSVWPMIPWTSSSWGCVFVPRNCERARSAIVRKTKTAYHRFVRGAGGRRGLGGWGDWNGCRFMFYGANRSTVLGPGSRSPFQKCLNPPQGLSLVTLEEICFLFLHYFYSNFQHYYLNDENYNIMQNVLIKEKMKRMVNQGLISLLPSKKWDAEPTHQRRRQLSKAKWFPCCDCWTELKCPDR